MGILAASGQIPLEALRDFEFLGELGLTGELRPVDGVLPAALAAANGAEAALAAEVEALTARTLLEVCGHLSDYKTLPRAIAPPCGYDHGTDLRDLRGQTRSRRALEIAGACSHHLLLGPPGCGKTLLASRLPGLLPDASEAEALEATAVASISGRGLDPTRWRTCRSTARTTPPAPSRWSAVKSQSDCDRTRVAATRAIHKNAFLININILQIFLADRMVRESNH